ncbi:NAD(P)-dependent dehydrogenase (short-subunit alcohol dehydrogenase family) [Limimaricola variabilis]|uniref:NAD(P)-dependent dehydrogenase (Short-subunit alcohol dehydrogenase family) n=1 Tax=Limimaricola variabilis TaxID=1492771 RepID=A0ABR6HJM3_9RHOB|nr:SDR family oxidoreductase [Limimaricola variabilis]MBB3710748.1 NAD(P)-dependent dehydrogenase (short-subunit alcohol dehydrogenase family) [Limimaricola variabilis]
MKHAQFGPKGWTPELLGNLSGKTYVITGANAGAGFQAARILLGKGAEVVMLNRSAEKSAAAVKELREEFGAAAPVRFIRMDLAEQASVRMAAEEVLKTTPRIDALICNAAIAQVPTRKLTPDGFESQLGTNHYGHFTLCGMLFDRIEEAQGRIVVVASLGYNMGLKTIRFDDMNWDEGYGANTAYSQSKLAQMMFAYELQDRVKAAGRNVEVYVCHPGSSATSLISTSGSRTMRLIWWLMTKTPMVQTAEQGAYPEVMCATEEGLTEQRALYGPTGTREFVGPVGRGTLNAHAHDKPVMVRLWERSEKDTGFSWAL